MNTFYSSQRVSPVMIQKLEERVAKLDAYRKKLKSAQAITMLLNRERPVRRTIDEHLTAKLRAARAKLRAARAELESYKGTDDDGGPCMNTSQQYEPTHADEMWMILVKVLWDLRDFHKYAEDSDRTRAENITLLKDIERKLKEINAR